MNNKFTRVISIVIDEMGPIATLQLAAKCFECPLSEISGSGVTRDGQVLLILKRNGVELTEEQNKQLWHFIITRP